MYKMRLFIGFFCLLSLSAMTPLSKHSVLSYSLANKAVMAAVEQCQKDGYHVAAAIVNRAGVVVAQLRSEAAGPHTIDSSQRKAYTAASLKEPTQKLAKLITKLPVIQGLRDMNAQILILGGGFPLIIEGELLGGIGVGGAPGAHLDETCARAGLALLGAQLFLEK